MANRSRSKRRVLRRNGGKRRSARGNTIPATRIEPARNRVPAMPPSLSLTSNVATLWIRSEYQFNEKGNLYINGYSFTQALDELGIAKLFGEMRVKRINFWWIPKNAITDAGLTTMCVADTAENTVTATSKFSDICGLPGSDTKRIYQNLACAWFPTEPQDRNWMPITNTNFCDIIIASSRDAAAEYNVYGSIIADAHVTLRGSTSTTGFNLLADPGSDGTSPVPSA